MSDTNEAVQPVLTWGISVPVAPAMLDNDPQLIEQAIVPQLAIMVQQKLDEGYRLISEGKIEIARDVTIPLADAFDDDDNPYNEDGSPVEYVTRSFVRKTVKLVPGTS
jgi:hypothetical protein